MSNEIMPGYHNFKASGLDWIKALPEEIRRIVEQEYYVNAEFAQLMAAECRTLEEIQKLRQTYITSPGIPKQSMIAEFMDWEDVQDIRPKLEEKMGWLEGRLDQNGVRVKMLTRRQVAQLFNVSPTTVDNWRAEGLLPYYRLGKNKVGFDPADVESFAEKIKAV